MNLLLTEPISFQWWHCRTERSEFRASDQVDTRTWSKAVPLPWLLNWKTYVHRCKETVLSCDIYLPCYLNDTTLFIPVNFNQTIWTLVVAAVFCFVLWRHDIVRALKLTHFFVSVTVLCMYHLCSCIFHLMYIWHVHDLFFPASGCHLGKETSRSKPLDVNKYVLPWPCRISVFRQTRGVQTSIASREIIKFSLVAMLIIM